MALKNMAAFLLVGVLLPGLAARAADEGESPGDDLAKAFAAPPDASKPWVYWWWLDGAASKEGITADLEAMKKQGISGALIFDAGRGGPDAPKGPLFMSRPWLELYRHALREAARLEIEIGVNLCSGWDAGGAWVTPEQAAKRLVFATMRLKGSGPAAEPLPKPTLTDGFYREIAVLAYPLGERDAAAATLSASTTYQDYGPELATDGADDSRWVSNGHRPGMGPTPEKPEYLEFRFAEPWSATALRLKPYPQCGPREVEIQSSDDGKTFRTLKRLVMEPRKEVTVSFAETRASHFRVVFMTSYPLRSGNASWNVQVSEIALLNQGQRAEIGGSPIEREKIVDLTARVDADGRLKWDVPEGKWEVMRLGYSLWGRKTKCFSSPEAQGYEIDFYDATAFDGHFDHTGEVLVKEAGQHSGTTLKYFHIDSHEAGSPTWTPRFREEFTKRRGYDPFGYLPALAGRTVETAEITERFRWDALRTFADLFAANHYGRLSERSKRHGLGTHPESGGPAHYVIDGLQTEGINDIPMGEFWKRNQEPDGKKSNTLFTIRQIAAAAHVYGKPVCQAEAFTSYADDWIDDPWSMKDVGDEAFCEGLTRNVLCFFVHQPEMKSFPGYQWPHVGTHFDRNITWFGKSHAWLTYLARCQHVLREGQFAADFAYFFGESANNFVPEKEALKPALPAGFDADVINNEILLGRTRAEEGRLALTSGMGYRYLVLMDGRTEAITPAVLGKLRELVEAGVTLVGERPLRAPGLTDYPRCDAEVKRLADALWGTEGTKSGSRQVGKGRVIWGKTLEEVVREDGLAPDIEAQTLPADARIAAIHRTKKDFDAYFVSNQTVASVRAACRFRISGRRPELWDAVTGQIRPLPEFKEEGGRTAVPLTLAPRQSFFVVFRSLGNQGTDGKHRTQIAARNFPDLKQIGEIGGGWDVAFDPKWGGPASARFQELSDWTRSDVDGIKYYSGTATYHKTFDLPPSAIRDPQPPIHLDLGVVKNVAEVRLNGRNLGVVWTAPWRVEITGAVKPQGNVLEIDVVNLWPNRLIGDARLPKEKRLTTTNVRTYETVLPPDSEYRTYYCTVCAQRRQAGQPAELLSSGLLGPVTLHVAD